VITQHVYNTDTMRELLDKSGLTSSDSYVVKPNWFFQGKGFYTDPKTLELLLECLDKVTIIESYTYQRNDGTRTITPENGRSNWDWLREQDTVFLRATGLDVLLREYNAEYVNLTEEVWSERIANPENIRKSVEARFAPVLRKQLYEQVPERIYALRGRKLISFAKLKHQTTNRVSATLKNMFGNIIDPNRIGWHGEDDRDLARSIVDVNKVYASLFDTVGLCEAIFTAVRYTKKGKYPLPWDNRYDLTENMGLAFYGDRLVDVDAYVSQACGIDPNKVEHLRLAAEVFGKWTVESIKEAEEHPIDLGTST
jgi:hypothetical protein